MIINPKVVVKLSEREQRKIDRKLAERETERHRLLIKSSREEKWKEK